MHRLATDLSGPPGFFLCSAGRDVTTPNRLIWLVWTGAVVLAAGVLALGIGLLAALTARRTGAASGFRLGEDQGYGWGRSPRSRARRRASVGAQ